MAGMFGSGRFAGVLGDINQSTERGLSPRLTGMLGDASLPMGSPPEVAASLPDPGMFKGPRKINWGGVITDALAGAAGRPGPYMAGIVELRQAEILAQLAEAKRLAGNQDWRARFDYEAEYERNNPKPVNNDTINDFNWYKALPDEDKSLYDRFHPVTMMGPNGPIAVPRSTFGAHSSGPQPGTVEEGYRFKGGNPSDPNAWEPVGGGVSNGPGNFPAPVKGKATGFDSYKSGSYDPLEVSAGNEFGVPPGVLNRLRVRGEKSNAGQVSEVGARSVYQVTPETRQLIIQKYKFDPWANPQDAARGAAIVARDMYRKFGNWNDAMTGYHGGNDTRNWGKRTQAYAQRTNF